MKNPFTHTPGKTGDAGISTNLEEEIYENFNYNTPSEYVYKIIGVRGSGKTVLYGNVLRHYESPEMKKLGWLVYDLSSTRDPSLSLISYMMSEPEVKRSLLKENVDLNISVPVVGVSAGIDLKNDLDVEVRLEQITKILVESKKRILIGIDDIAKTKEMTQFCSIYAKLIRNTMDDGITPWPVFLICSGVYENYYDLGEVPNLTFFKRAAEIKTEPLSIPAMSIKYEDMLEMDEESAISFAKETKGFAFAYQVFGNAYFKYKEKGMDYVRKQAKSELFAQCYEKIWKELPNGERDILRVVSNGSVKRKDILSDLDSKGSYQVNSTTLKNMGLLSSEVYGEVSITLPYFDEYVLKYCS